MPAKTEAWAKPAQNQPGTGLGPSAERWRCYHLGMTRIGSTLLAILALTAVILIAFGLTAVPADTPADTVTGQVAGVEPASLTTISSLTIEDDSGREWTFEGVGTFAGFTPSHLEEHRTLREPVTVEYEETPGGILIILSLSD